ncbi:serpin family protein [Balneolaceae bacterium ANBcel3]|nr:serpin family protein [Balneolaceae bacterium ANBcel3]
MIASPFNSFPRIYLIVSLFTLSSLLLFSSCDLMDSGKEAIEEESKEAVSEARKKIIEESNTFTFDLLSMVAQENAQESFFLSPLSITLAFGMALNGAYGYTYDQMRDFFGLQGLSNEEINENFQALSRYLTERDPLVRLQIANSVWYRDSFEVLTDFLEANRHFFDAEIESLDFSDPKAPDIINAWIHEKTHGLIDEMIEDISPQTVLFLINALYFQGDWAIQFDPEQTRDAPFTMVNGEQTMVPMMQVSEEFYHYSGDDWKVIDVPYGDHHYRFTAFLPADQKSDNNFAKSFSRQQYQDLLGRLSKDTVDVYIPRFEIDFDYENIKEDLIHMGLTYPFSKDRLADFSRISANEPLEISDVMHRAVISVDEEGSEAAAVTVIEIIRTSIGEPERAVIRLNRPFIFFIRDAASDSILFMGFYAGT